MDVRKVIVNRMNELGWTKYRLAVKVAPKIQPGRIYDFFRGSEMNARNLGHVFDALGLKLVAAPDSIGTPKGSKVRVAAGRKRKQKDGK